MDTHLGPSEHVLPACQLGVLWLWRSANTQAALPVSLVHASWLCSTALQTCPYETVLLSFQRQQHGAHWPCRFTALQPWSDALSCAQPAPLEFTGRPMDYASHPRRCGTSVQTLLLAAWARWATTAAPQARLHVNQRRGRTTSLLSTQPVSWLGRVHHAVEVTPGLTCQLTGAEVLRLRRCQEDGQLR